MGIPFPGILTQKEKVNAGFLSDQNPVTYFYWQYSKKDYLKSTDIAFIKPNHWINQLTFLTVDAFNVSGTVIALGHDKDQFGVARVNANIRGFFGTNFHNLIAGIDFFIPLLKTGFTLKGSIVPDINSEVGIIKKGFGFAIIEVLNLEQAVGFTGDF